MSEVRGWGGGGGGGGGGEGRSHRNPRGESNPVDTIIIVIYSVVKLIPQFSLY